MGSILGLTSILLLVRLVHLQYTGSKPQENDLLSMKHLLINTIDKELIRRTSFMALLLGTR